MKSYLSLEIIIFSSFLLIISNCKENKPKRNVFETINIESNIKNFIDISLSQLNAEIQYVPVKSDKNQVISRINRINIAYDLLLVSNTDICLLYDKSGELITKIGEKGRGPNQFQTILNTCFGFNKNIYIQNINKFLEFKTNGAFIKSFDLNKEKNPGFYMQSWITINDSLFLGQIPNSSGHEKNKAILFDNNGNIKYVFKNYTFLKRPSMFFSSDDGQASFYSFESKIHFKEKLNDTLFSLNGNYELQPILSFKIGKYAHTKESRETSDMRVSDPFNFIYVNNIFEIKDFLFIDCDFEKFFPARRITPREVMGQQTWYNTANALGIYYKESKSLVFCKPTSTDNPLFTTGLYNDIDAGPRFYPKTQVNDSTLLMWIEAKQLKDHIESDDFKDYIPKFPEKKKALEDMANKLSEFDNPVLMFVTFKNK